MRILALVLAIVFIVLAVLAATGAVNFHSRALGLDGAHHVKHALLYVVLCILALIWMRFAAADARAR